MIQQFIQRVRETLDVEAASRITVDDLVSTPRSGLLVAEGGMGKSDVPIRLVLLKTSKTAKRNA